MMSWDPILTLLALLIFAYLFCLYPAFSPILELGFTQFFQNIRAVLLLNEKIKIAKEDETSERKERKASELSSSFLHSPCNFHGEFSFICIPAIHCATLSTPGERKVRLSSIIRKINNSIINWPTRMGVTKAEAILSKTFVKHLSNWEMPREKTS